LGSGASADGKSAPRILARDPSGAFLYMDATLDDAEAAMGPARQLMSALEGSFDVDGQEIFVTASIGVAVHPVDGHDAETLLRNAHAARGGVKSSGSSGFSFYARNMNENAVERIRLENALRKTVDEGGFTLHYQPKVETRTGTPFGMEALIRWECPGLGRVSPGKFIPIAEDHGLIVPIGEWVIRETCEQMRRWDEAGLPPLRCSVNIAAQQLETGDFEATVARILKETGTEASRLELELTERALMNDADGAKALLQRLRDLGCHVSLDDFGTGYSSLSYLNRFPLDVVKLDRSFILDVPGSEDQSTLVAALITLAKKLRLDVVAEGVETEPQRAFLESAGCDRIQGFFFSKPLAADDFAEWVRERLSRPLAAHAG
ncbi:MAG: GGDEF domain-containing phosphodiesterase, partial [Myxococcota bacterium]